MVQIAHGFGADADANKKSYDEWGTSYEKDVRDWGYTIPEGCTRMLRGHAAEVETFKVLDADAGDGLSGQVADLSKPIGFNTDQFDAAMVWAC